MSVTDEDRANATELLHRLVAGSRQGVACSCGWSGPGRDHEEHATVAIAAALAAEREKVRAPFLRIAERLESDKKSVADMVGRICVADAANLIRHAAQDQP